MNPHIQFIEIRSKYTTPNGKSLDLYDFWVKNSYPDEDTHALIEQLIHLFSSKDYLIQISAIQAFGACAKSDQNNLLISAFDCEDKKYRVDILASLNFIDL